MCSNPLPPETESPARGPGRRTGGGDYEREWLALATDDVGEIVIRGKNVTLGYIKNPKRMRMLFMKVAGSVPAIRDS
ncbi:MAG: hypothetical protein Ct9H300mP8_12830 [Gammaproteobacteria bacterium]|nr:MAG: hypothetical protein Ct9H300mP8_12830 [Gammaproteobacteria bacterium]